ncbi:hypothetical protein, partial [Cellulomonas sp. IC4_254]|uniref:hypothetical protein n=1 Tax=Cellulomonas sp. IC4_254 TaxID=2714040 RepID=UPI00141F22E7
MPPVFHSDPRHPSLRTFVRDPSVVARPPLSALPAGLELLRRAQVAARSARSAASRRAAWATYRRADALLHPHRATDDVRGAWCSAVRGSAGDRPW